VLWLDWQRALALDSAMSALAGQPAPGIEDALQRLVNERLVLRLARHEGISATVGQAEARLVALLARWGASEAQLSAALTQAGLTRAQVLEAIRRLLMVEAYLARFDSDESASRWLAQQRQQAKVGIYVNLAAQAQPPPLLAAATPATPLVLMPATPTAAPSSPTLPASTLPTPTPPPENAAPDFTLPDLKGQPVSLSQFRGQVVVLNIWASWCPSCRAETQDVAEFARQYRSRGVTVVGVNLREDAATVRAFAEANGIDYPLLLDSQGAVAAQYQVVGIPTTVIIDAAGGVRGRHVGVLTQAQLAEYVAAWLPARSPAPAFTLPRENGQPVSLADYRGRSVVLLFYRNASCGSCQQQLAGLQAAYNRFQARRAELLAIAVQSVAQAGVTQQLGHLTFPVLADDEHLASEAFGVYNRLGDGLAAPAVFVIDREGSIAWSYIGQSASDYPSPEAILEQIP
ncbi:MAG: redoxin domain-containing protein, partial [Aggregatilineales bacterium]